MKAIYIVVILVLSYAHVNAQQINWMSMNEALEAQKKDPKKIFVDVYTPWCGPCKLMDKRTFTHPKLVKYINTYFYAVKFNAEGIEEVNYNDFTYTNPNYDMSRSKNQRNSQHLFAHALKVTAYPTVVFFDEESNIISPVVGYKTPTQLELFLKMVATDQYKEIKTQEAWQDYQKDFKSTF